MVLNGIVVLVILEIWSVLKMVLIKCACPCKTLFEENDKYGRKRRYINGHQKKGITRTQEFKNKMSVIMKGKFKGKHFSPKTEFKKGIIPWNKGKNNVFSEEACFDMYCIIT